MTTKNVHKDSNICMSALVGERERANKTNFVCKNK